MSALPTWWRGDEQHIDGIIIAEAHLNYLRDTNTAEQCLIQQSPFPDLKILRLSCLCLTLLLTYLSIIVAVNKGNQ